MSLTHIKDANNSWSVVVNNQSYTFDSKHPEYISLVDCVRSGDSEKFISLLSVGQAVENWSQGSFKFVDGNLFYGEDQVHRVITNRIIEMIKQNFDYQPMLMFVQRLYMNPSYRAIQELYEFLAHQFLPITSDGYFLAYKYIRRHSGETIVDKNGNEIKDGDFVDCHTGRSYRNNPGDNPTMPRHQVDDNFNNACSAGLHVGSKSYSARSGGHSLICKVDPADVVSVPKDHDAQKVRTCSYYVVEVFENQDLSPAMVDEYDDLDEDLDEDLDDDFDGELDYGEDDYYDEVENDVFSDDEDDIVW